MSASRMSQATLPVPSPTKAYWQKNAATWLESAPSDPLPSEADIVIIGSGFTGSLCALNLLRTLPLDSKVVMVEARTATSGATGRNGGHIKPDLYLGFRAYRDQFGTDFALQNSSFERANYQESVAFIKQENLASEVDLQLLQSADVFMTPVDMERAQAVLKDFADAGGDVNGIHIQDATQARKAFRIKGCQGAITFPAATLWPYKLATAILTKAIGLGLQLFTSCPVLSVEPSSRECASPWIVITPKGRIRTRKVVHATNAYASYLLPELTGRILPTRGHAACVASSPEFYRSPLAHSCSVHWNDNFEYLLQRPNDGKRLVYGGCDLAAGKGLFIGVGHCDDSTIEPSIEKSLLDYAARNMIDWDRTDSLSARNDIPSDEDQVWTGIMGFTPDEIPYVGEVPTKKGQFIAAGFCGHGMARIFLVSKALCEMIRGQKVDERVPRAFFDLDRRWSHALENWKQILGEEIVETTIERAAL